MQDLNVIDKLAEQAYKTARKTNGYSLNTKGETPKDGFMVSLPSKEVRVPKKYFTKEVIAVYLAFYWDEMKDNQYFGAWWSGEEWFLDISVRCEEMGEAVKLGMEWDQLAIYDAGNKEVISL